MVVINTNPLTFFFFIIIFYLLIYIYNGSIINKLELLESSKIKYISINEFMLIYLINN